MTGRRKRRTKRLGAAFTFKIPRDQIKDNRGGEYQSAIIADSVPAVGGMNM